jgi:hypothetical protein
MFSPIQVVQWCTSRSGIDSIEKFLRRSPRKVVHPAARQENDPPRHGG